ncbi:MAG: hypothetical protein ACP5E5_08375 [Acidobacteriaceae bacterium]
MISLTEDQQLFLSYVLDQLSPEKRSELDEKLITSQDLSDAFQQARHDLIDAYAADALPPHIRLQVEQAILSTEDAQTALSMARALHRLNSPPNPPQPIRPPEPRPHHTLLWLQDHKTSLGWFTSTLAACFVLALVFFHSRQRILRQAATLPPGSSIPQKTTTAPSQSNPAPNQATVLAVAMPMETLRGDHLLSIPLHPWISQIHLQWPLPADATVSACTLQIASTQAASNHSNVFVLPQQGPLQAIGHLRVANFFIPANALPTGQVLFRLRAADAADHPLLAESPVQISR